MSTLVCDVCGGVLYMESNGEFAVCDSCGLHHSKERLKVKAQEINGVVEITKGEVEKERLLSNAEIFLELGDISKADNLFVQITNEYPNDYRGWFGSFRCQFKYNDIKVQNVSIAENCEEKINKLGYSNLTDLYWETFFKERRNFTIIERNHIEYKNVYSILDDFSTELICYETKKLSPKLKKLQLLLGEEYVNKFLCGDILTFTTDKYYRNRGFWGELLGFGTFGVNLNKSDVLAPLFNMGLKNAQLIEMLPKREYKEYLNSVGIFDHIDKIKVLFLLGKTILFEDYFEMTSYELREINKLVTKETIGDLCEKNDIDTKCFMLTREQCIDAIINKFNKASDKMKIFQDFHFEVDNYAFVKKIVSVEEFYFDITHIPATPASLTGQYCIFAKGTIFYAGKQIVDDKVGVLNAEEAYGLFEKVDRYFNNIKIENLKNVYRINGVCQYCGESFTGFFKKKCSNCGKEKDY